MPLRSSLARSLQYAMANMADIKTPLCALQPTPAIPHTASRSGAGTRARGGGSAGSSGRRHGARVPPTPGARRPRCPRLAARGPRPPRAWRRPGRSGRSDAGSRLPAPPLAARTRSLSHARSLPAPFADRRRCTETMCTARRLSEWPWRENWLGGAIARDRRAPAPVTPARSRDRGRGDAGGHGRGRWG